LKPPRRLSAVLACAVAVLATGCGIDDPYDDQQRPDAAPSSPAPAAARPLPAAGARALLTRFALTWTNWSFGELAENRRELAGLATGTLRTMLLEEARRAAQDAALRASNLGNRGTVAGIVLRTAAPALVVTRETVELEDGGGQTAYAVYLARAVRTPNGWKLAEWTPTS
jgi:hypothetical protein